MRSQERQRPLGVGWLAVGVEHRAGGLGVEGGGAVVGELHGSDELAHLAAGQRDGGDDLALVEGERGDVDEPLDRGVGTGVGDDRAAVAVADEHDVVETVEHGTDVVGVGVEVGAGQVDGGGRYALLVEAREHLGPAPRPVPGAVDEDDRSHGREVYCEARRS